MLATRRLIGLALAAMLVPASGFAQSQSPEAQKIEELEAKWVELIRERDAAGIAALYAEDGRVMPPNARTEMGREDVQKLWEEILQLPNLELSFEATDINVAGSGDMAYAIGTYQLSHDSEQGRVQDAGKYIEIWEKVDGEWKVKADMFSSNLPPQ